MTLCSLILIKPKIKGNFILRFEEVVTKELHVYILFLYVIVLLIISFRQLTTRVGP
jgi:hypothetical protein